MNTAIAALKSELNKQEEALEDCRRYKEFLDSVTHPEWFEAQAAKQKVTDMQGMWCACIGLAWEGAVGSSCLTVAQQ